MAKQGHESLESYMENINVKISEKYKPPPRINLATTYAQRLNLNKQIQDNIPKYNFQLEKNVLDRIKEWKQVRSSTVEDRKARLVKNREDLKKRQLEIIKQEKLKEDEVTVPVSDNLAKAPNASPIINTNYTNYSTNNILLPMRASACSNILTPIPLDKTNLNNHKPVDKSPFNISDFENDTSSPFDNMELKSINDMEELAQVLKGKEPYNAYSYQTAQPNASSQIQANYGGYLCSYDIPATVPYRPTDYSTTNGYYYPSTGQNYGYNEIAGNNYGVCSQTQCAPLSNTKSVPDIMKSLRDELNSSRIEEKFDNDVSKRFDELTVRPKSSEAIYPRTKKKTDDLDDPYHLLSRNQQDLCKSISLMGFPLSRVARTCKLIGDDHKKIVEHLLALSDLLDLGFSEMDVSSALFHCNNDRDKALDKLIS